MKTKTKQTQRQRLLAYLKRNRKGITTREAMIELGICCLHKRIAELESETEYVWERSMHRQLYPITRHREKTASGATVTRYKLSR